jgi:flagellar assembly protein FliH
MGVEQPVRPYAFERIFALSAADPCSNPQDQALQLLALQAELARQQEESSAALAQARADGFAAGLAQARSDTASALLMAEEALVAGIAKLEAGFLKTETRIAGAAAEVAMTAAEQLAARAIAADPCLAIDQALGRVLTQIGFRETLHIHVHPSLADALQAVIEHRGSLAQRPLSIIVHPEADLPPGDAHILWDEGGLSLDAAARNAAVREALGLAAPAS